jgi:outer membrane protein assembly factor BamB
METRTLRQKSWWIPVAIIAVGAALMVWAHLEETFIRFYAYAFLPILAAILVAIWYVATLDLPGETRRRFLLGGLTSLFGLGLLLGFLFRWDDTWGGTSLIKPTWRWTPRKEETAASLRLPATVTKQRRGEVEGSLRDWPRYLGPDGDGTVHDLRLNPDWKGSPPRELWRQPIGVGWASFAVVDRNAITLEQRGQEEWITCRDVVSGDLIWTHKDPLGDFAPAMGGRGPRSTPAIRDGRVYTQGVLGRLNCLDLDSGKLLWTHEVLAELEAANLEWGKSNTPFLWKNLVITTGGSTETTPLLAAYEVGTGKPVWRSANGAASYSTPLVLRLADQEVLVYLGQYGLTGHDPATGKTLWKWDWPGAFPKVAQPQLVGENRILLTASYGVGSHLLDLSSGTPVPVWKTNRMKTKFSTAVVSGNHAYGFDEGALACIELTTGKRLWKGGDYGFGQNLLVGDLLLVQAEQGALALVAAKPDEFQEVARIPALNGVTWNVPTLAGNYLLIRNDTEAICYWVSPAP